MKKYYLDLPEGQIHYIKSGQGTPLLLLHQAPLCSAEWESVIPYLSEHFEVFAPDMVGHGQSYNPEREFFIENFTATTVNFMDALDIQSVYVVGNHSGAALGTSLAVNHPERVKKIIISCEMLASTELLKQFVEAFKSKPLTRDLPMDEQGQFIADAWRRYINLTAPSTPLEIRYIPFIHGQLARLKPYDIHESVLLWMASDDWMAKLSCPTLVFGADKDIFFDRQRLIEAPERFAHIQSRIISDAGAFSTFEQPEAIANMILNFFRYNNPHK